MSHVVHVAALAQHAHPTLAVDLPRCAVSWSLHPPAVAPAPSSGPRSTCCNQQTSLCLNDIQVRKAAFTKKHGKPEWRIKVVDHLRFDSHNSSQHIQPKSFVACLQPPLGLSILPLCEVIDLSLQLPPTAHGSICPKTNFKKKQHLSFPKPYNLRVGWHISVGVAETVDSRVTPQLRWPHLCRSRIAKSTFSSKAFSIRCSTSLDRTSSRRCKGSCTKETARNEFIASVQPISSIRPETSSVCSLEDLQVNLVSLLSQ